MDCIEWYKGQTQEILWTLEDQFQIKPNDVVSILPLFPIRTISIRLQSGAFIGKQLNGGKNGACLGFCTINGVEYVFWDNEEYEKELEGLHGCSK